MHYMQVPSQVEYERATSVEHALSLLSRPDTRVVAGGHSLIPMMKLRLAQPELLVDISKLPETRQVVDGADAVTIGACVTHAAIEDGAVPDPANGMLAAVAGGIAYRAVRNRGTIGGSLAHADPAADWPSDSSTSWERSSTRTSSCLSLARTASSSIIMQ